MAIYLKRAYEKPEKTDGYRILVDRLWPRGESKEIEEIDLWLKNIAPSNELRKWFAHDPNKYNDFKQKYQVELNTGLQQEAFNKLKQIIKEYDIITLVYGAKDEKHNNAVVLYNLLTN